MATPKTTASKPNILVIWGDDIGISNLSCYSDGLMGYRTPNIDRIANEGMRFTDSYGEQSCTAGRSSFITGQSVFRTGLSKVGDVTLKRGLIGSLSLYNWLNDIRYGNQNALRTVRIQLQSEDHTQVVQTWTLRRARIVKHTSGPLHARGSDVGIEEIVLAYERLV